MNLNNANKQNLQWEVDRYLLLDPLLDRDAFERRMLADVELAEMVAASVSDLQAISSAARLCDKLASGSGSCEPTALAEHEKQSRLCAKSQTRTYWAISVTAALVLLTVSVWQFGSGRNEEQLSQIADNWAAFEGLTTGETLELIANDEPSTENHTDVEANEQSDWLVEAAREFYLAKNDGAAG